MNVKKVNELMRLGKMKPEGLHLFNNRIDIKGDSSDDRDVTLSKKIRRTNQGERTCVGIPVKLGAILQKRLNLVGHERKEGRNPHKTTEYPDRFI